MRSVLPVLLLVSACASNTQGEWPTLAPRPGEISADGAAFPTCPGCGPAAVEKPLAVVAPPPPLPADTDARLGSIVAEIAEVEAKAPAQARRADIAIAAARSDPARSGDAEVERSRFETLFLSLGTVESRLDTLGDEIAGRAGADAAEIRIAALRARLAALQASRGSLEP